MALPMPFQISGGNISPSYDWFDFAAGAGYKRFYAAACDISGSTLYFLTSKQIDGDVTARSVTITNTNTELNFDITFNSPITIATSEAVINWTTQQSNGASVYAIFTFYHVDASSTETSIGTVTTSTRNAGADVNDRRLTKVSLTQKSFGVGEKLRLEVKFYTSGAGKNATIFYDPASRQTFAESATGATIGSDLTIDVPFRIDL